MFGWGVNPSRCKELVNSVFLRAGRISPQGQAPHAASGSSQSLKRILNNMRQSSVPVWQFLCSYKNHVSFFFFLDFISIKEPCFAHSHPLLSVLTPVAGMDLGVRGALGSPSHLPSPPEPGRCHQGRSQPRQGDVGDKHLLS